jgi:tetratricopeptide (TPR) repeat protein
MKIADLLANSRGAPPQANLIRMRFRERMGEIRMNEGKIAAALEFFQQGEEIGENINSVDPANSENLQALADLYLANARDEVDTSRSIAAARKLIAIAERLSAAQPENREVQYRFSDAHSMVGTTLLRNNLLRESFDELQKATTLREELVAAEPLNIRYKRDLMISYSKLGDVLGPVTPSLLDGPRALENYRKALALARTLASDRPTNAPPTISEWR